MNDDVNGNRLDETLELTQLLSLFYRQIAQLKVWLREGDLNQQVSRMMQLNTLPEPQDLATAINLQLQAWLAKTRQHYKPQLTPREYQRLEQALYAMVALADELLVIELDWPGREAWQDTLLEQSCYHTSAAGERVFDDIDRLLTQRSHNALCRQLAAVYLIVLRLGFSGRYRSQQQQLSEYRTQLFALMGPQKNMQAQPTCAQAYQHNLETDGEQRLAPLKHWYKGLLFVVLGYGLMGMLVWGYASA